MIRWNYIIPRLILVFIIYIFFYLFFDKLLKIAIERSIELVAGAKVEIKKVKTSFIKGSFEIENMAVGNPKEEFQNLFEFEKLHFKLNTNQLLRKKFIIEDASIKGLIFNTKRKTSAKIKKSTSPPNPYIDYYKKSIENFALERFDNIKEITKKEIDIKIDELETLKVIDEIKSKKTEEYKKLYEEISSFDIETRIKKIENDFKEFKEEKNIIKKAKIAKDLKKEIDSLSKDIKEKEKKIKESLRDIKNYAKLIDDTKKRDLKRIKEIATIPSFDASTISNFLFGQKVIDEFQKYYGIAQNATIIKKYLPQSPKKTLFVEKRRRGRYIHYRLKEVYPQFLLTKASVQGVISPQKPIKFFGSIENVTNNPSIYKRPLTVKVLGEDKSNNFKFNLSLNLSTSPIYGNIFLNITNLSINNVYFGSKNFEYKIKKALYDITIDGNFTTETINIPIKIFLYDLASEAKFILSNKEIASVIERSLNSINRFNLNVILSGKISKPDITIKSDVSDVISKNISLEFQRKIDELNKKVLQRIELEIDKKTKELQEIVEENEKKIIEKIKLDTSTIDKLKERFEKESLKI